jgi:hypothetical protein
VKLGWILLLLLGLNLVYLGWGLYRAQGPDHGRAIPPVEAVPGVSEIRLIDSLADSPPPETFAHPEAEAGSDQEPRATDIVPGR